MKADCKSVRREIDAADPGWQPPKPTQAHLASCEPCAGFYQQEQRLRELVGGLGTVAAPPDFDFRLRARLAADKPLNHGFSLAGFSFGFRAAALATLVVAIGAAFLFRGIGTRQTSQTVNADNQVEKSKEDAGIAKPPVTAVVHPNETGKPVANEPSESPRPNRAKVPRREVAANRGTVSKDFSSAPAEVVQHTAAATEAAAAFQIESPSESLKLSLDDLNGVSRTISLPRISFGSQRFVAGDASSVIKTNAKGVW